MAMPVMHQEVDDTGKLLRPQVTEAADEHEEAESADAEDSTTLKCDGPVQLSDEDVGNDPYNRTGKFKRLIRS
jgi:hypothetical protein